ncbi:hypothetical protein [Methylobacter sp.]|uniref:hypothetical protein n=1 Tax=Methylobacter sp. TaxID=2051955 RepID=UPI00272FA7D8|nr:hypothetical protein [Methylobacter sp.]
MNIDKLKYEEFTHFVITNEIKGERRVCFFSFPRVRGNAVRARCAASRDQRAETPGYVDTLLNHKPNFARHHKIL